MMARALLLALLLAVSVLAPAGAAETLDAPAVAAEIRARGDAVLAGYDPEHGRAASKKWADLYFDLFEGSGLEAAIGAADPALKTTLESQFSGVIGLANKGAERETVAAAWAGLAAAVTKAAQPPAGREGPAAMFLQSLLILLREGFEAVLVVGALAAYLRRLGAEDRLRVVYGGVALAVAASLATAWVLDRVITVSGAQRDVVEGATMLVAAAVLAYVSHWLFARREAARWQGYIRDQIERAVSRGQVLSLGFAAFLAVYREGAETVLFYRALAGGAPDQMPALWAGLAAAIVALALLWVVLRRVTVRLPLGLFFGATAALLYAMALVFAGSGVLEMQEAHWLPATPLAWAPRIAWLGVFPSAETLAAQGLLLLGLVPLVITWLRNRKPT